MVSFGVTLRTSATLHPDGEPSDFVSEYEGVVNCTDEGGTRTTVGRVKALKVHAGLAADHGESLSDVCDSHSQELHVLHTLLYQPRSHGFRDVFVRRFEAMEADLLVLDYVVLAPKWRKLKVGLLAVRKLVDLLGGGCGLVVSDIRPLRHDAHSLLNVPARWLPRHRSRADHRAATATLRRYYRRMGFERLGRTPFYALPTALTTPSAADLLGGGPVVG